MVIWSLGPVEEQGNSGDNSPGGFAAVGNVECAQEGLPVEVVVNRDLYTPILCNGFGLVLRNPGDRTRRKALNLGSLALDFSQLASIERATLQPQTIQNDGVFAAAASLEVRHKLELVDSNLLQTSVALTERIQERLWVEQIVQPNLLLHE